MLGVGPPCWARGVDALPERARETVSGIVIHRIEVSQEDPSYGDGPADVIRFFCEHPTGLKATGGAMPYPLLVDSLGQVTQCVPLGRITPHAAAHNPTTIGVAAVGDFRSCAPSTAQLEALVQTSAALARVLGLGADAVFGHDELAGGSRTPDKVCPGDQLSMPMLRRRIGEAMANALAPTWTFVW